MSTLRHELGRQRKNPELEMLEPMQALASQFVTSAGSNLVGYVHVSDSFRTDAAVTREFGPRTRLSSVRVAIVRVAPRAAPASWRECDGCGGRHGPVWTGKLGD